MNSYDMHDLVDEEELGRRIDAVPRILKPEMLDKEQFCRDDKRYFSKLSDLEHASMMDFNCKEDCAAVYARMDGRILVDDGTSARL